MSNVSHSSAGNLATLTFDEIAMVGGGLTASQVSAWGNAAMSAGGVAAMVGAEPAAAFLVGFGIGCHVVAAMAE